jgi:hypothetical protein
LAEPLEAGEVELLGLDVQQVAGGAPLQALCREQLAQRGDVDLERRCRRLGRALAPEAVAQHVVGDGLVRVQEQDRQKGALVASAQGQRTVAVANLQRPE